MLAHAHRCFSSRENCTWSLVLVGILVLGEDHTWSLTLVRVPDGNRTWSPTFDHVLISSEDLVSHQTTLVLYFNSPLHHDAFEKTTIKGRIMSRT